MIGIAGTSPAMTKWEPPRVLPLLPCVVTSAAAAVPIALTLMGLG